MPLPLILAASCVVFALPFILWRGFMRWAQDVGDHYESERFPD